LPEIILLNVLWYCRYPLSYRNLEQMMQEQAVDAKAAKRFLCKMLAAVHT
jgi:hypothetical protein